MSALAANRLGLTASYAWCQRLARQQAGNFYYAFRFLPAAQRRAMCALYAFMRVADDLADASEPVADKAPKLARWRDQLGAALLGEYSHPLHAALHHTVRSFGVPPRHLEEVLNGVAMDLVADHYETFAELYRYCYHVASAVGLACIHVWGFRNEQALIHAEAAGVALQLTNILRDLAEDAVRGRVYLPREDLVRFGYSAEALARGQQDRAFRELMAFEVARARRYYEAAEPLAAMLDTAGRAVFLVILRTYRGLLDAIQRRDYDVFSRRVRLGRFHKLWLATRAIPARLGWA